MRTSGRSFLAGLTLSYMVVFGTAVVAAAADGAVAIVNGSPGSKVDVCLNGKEIKSKLPYAGKLARLVAPGPQTLKFYKPDTRTCKGTLVATFSFELSGLPSTINNDYTLVLTKRYPKVLIFDNTAASLGRIPPTGPAYTPNRMAWRDASDLGPINLYQRSWTANDGGPLAPAALPVWDKGDQGTYTAAPESEWRLWATRPELTTKLADSGRFATTTGRRYEIHLVGTSKTNARFVTVARDISNYY